MIKVSDSYSLSLLFFDVYRVLTDAFKEFEGVKHQFVFDSKSRRVKCVRFLLTSRKSYYVNVFPYNIVLFEHLDMLSNNRFSGFSFVRYSVDSCIENGVKEYSLVLWY